MATNLSVAQLRQYKAGCLDVGFVKKATMIHLGQVSSLKVLFYRVAAERVVEAPLGGPTAGEHL